jgi:integrase/recombinase XerD
MDDGTGAAVQQTFGVWLETNNLSPVSCRQYEKQVRRFERWCYSRQIVPDQATGRQVTDYSRVLPDTWASRKGAQNALRQYFRWAGRDDQPEQAMRVPRQPRSKPRPLGRPELDRLVDVARMHGGRQGLAVLVGLYLGARRSEIAAMPWSAWTAGTVRWQRAKTGDVTVLPCHPVLAEALAAHRVRSSGVYLFPGDRGRPHVSPTTVWEWIRQVGRLADVELTPHQLRHSFATYALQATKDVRGVQDALGHRDPASTAGYAAVSGEQLAAVVGALAFGHE